MFLDSIHHGLYSSRLRRHSQNGLFNSRIIGATWPKDQKACLPRYDQCKTIATKTDNIPSENRKLLSVVQCLVQERKSLLSEVELYLYRQVVSGSNNARIVGILTMEDNTSNNIYSSCNTKSGIGTEVRVTHEPTSSHRNEVRQSRHVHRRTEEEPVMSVCMRECIPRECLNSTSSVHSKL